MMREGCKAVILALLIVILAAPASAYVFDWKIYLSTGGYSRSFCYNGYTTGVNSDTAFFVDRWYVYAGHCGQHTGGADVGYRFWLDGQVTASANKYGNVGCGVVQSYTVTDFWADQLDSCGRGFSSEHRSRQTAGGWAVTYNTEEYSNTITLEEGPKPLGDAGDLAEMVGKNANYNSDVPAYVTTADPQVMMWVGDQTDYTKKSTTTKGDIVWACLDTNRNNKCDAEEDGFSDCKNGGGDWYKGVCCGGTDSTEFWGPAGGTPKYVEPCDFYGEDLNLKGIGNAVDVNAICGETTPGNAKWAPLDDVGETQELLHCPGISIVSNGTDYYGCNATNAQLGITNFEPFTFANVTSLKKTHEYFCVNDFISECQGDDPSFSTINSRQTGFKTSDITGQRCPDNLVSHWHLDSDGEDKTGLNDASAVSGVSFVSGKTSNAADFGSGDYIEVPSSASLSPTELTIEAWIKPSDVSGYNPIVLKRNGYALYIDNGILKGLVSTTGTSPNIFVGDRTIQKDQWTHVAMTFKNGELKFYVNGDFNSNTFYNFTGRLASATGPFLIGQDKGQGDQFVGLIDELAFYNRALGGTLIGIHSQKVPDCLEVDVEDGHYCASDGDWTKDLDTKDESTCNAAGFEWTGTKCCSEEEDPNEYYNEISTPAADFNQVITVNYGSFSITADEILLDENNDSVTIQGPARVIEEHISQRQKTGRIEDCDYGAPFNVETYDIPGGESRTVTLIEPTSEEPAGSQCSLRKTKLYSKPIIARGGCWDKSVVLTGDFIDSKSVVNYQGEFMGCKVTNQSLLSIDDYHIGDQLINNVDTACGKLLPNATQEIGSHLACSPEGFWHFVSEYSPTVEKNVTWDVSQFPGTHTTGCCPNDMCWNGTGCQQNGTFYRIGMTGFACR